METNVSPMTLIITTLVLLCAGCSGLQHARYFVPTTPPEAAVNDMPYIRSTLISGSPIATTLSLPGIKVTLRITDEDAFRNSHTVSFGPVIFPVLPAIWNWFRDPRQSGTQLSAKFVVAEGTVTWIPEGSTIRLQGGAIEKISKVEIPGTGKLRKQNGPLSFSGDNTTIYLTFDLERKCDEFILVLAPLQTEKGEVKVPPIEFKRTKSWLIWAAP